MKMKAILKMMLLKKGSCLSMQIPKGFSQKLKEKTVKKKRYSYMVEMTL